MLFNVYVRSKSEQTIFKYIILSIFIFITHTGSNQCVSKVISGMCDFIRLCVGMSAL